MSNAEKLKHPGGRPPLFGSVEKLSTVIEEYFESCNPRYVLVEKLRTSKNGKTYHENVVEKTPALPKTLSGLARALGVDRKTLYNYGRKAEFFPTISRARGECEIYAEEQLHNKHGYRGAMFTLSCNFGWGRKRRRNQQDVNELINSLEDATAS